MLRRTTRLGVAEMPTGWYPPGRHRARATGRRDPGGAPAATSRRRDRRRPPQVLQVDCTGVYVEPVTLRHRLESHLLADRLDRALAMGVEPESDVLLALRAERLARASTRFELAAALERLLRLSAEPPHGLSRTPSLAVLSRVAAARAEIESLVEHLLAPVPVPARGVALVRLLLRDGTGPLFRYESTADLALQVRQAGDALDPGRDWPS